MPKSEALIQQEMVEWFRRTHYKKGLIFSVPNERSGYQQIKPFLLTGLLSGVSDLIVVLEGVVVFFEVKTLIGTQKPKQKKFQENVKNLGFNYHIVRDLETFKEIVLYIQK